MDGVGRLSDVFLFLRRALFQLLTQRGLDPQIEDNGDPLDPKTTLPLFIECIMRTENRYRRKVRTQKSTRT